MVPAVSEGKTPKPDEPPSKKQKVSKLGDDSQPPVEKLKVSKATKKALSVPANASAGSSDGSLVYTPKVYSAKRTEFIQNLRNDVLKRKRYCLRFRCLNSCVGDLLRREPQKTLGPKMA